MENLAEQRRARAVGAADGKLQARGEAARHGDTHEGGHGENEEHGLRSG